MIESGLSVCLSVSLCLYLSVCLSLWSMMSVDDDVSLARVRVRVAVCNIVMLRHWSLISVNSPVEVVIYFLDDDVSLAQPDRDELQNVLRTLNSKLEDIRTCSDLIHKHGSSLQRALVDLEQSDCTADAAAKMKPVNERATLFRITSSAMINVRISTVCHSFECLRSVTAFMSTFSIIHQGHLSPLKPMMQTPPISIPLPFSLTLPFIPFPFPFPLQAFPLILPYSRLQIQPCVIDKSFVFIVTRAYSSISL